MQIELRLKALLEAYGLDRFGVITQIANDLRVNRHTITKIYQNKLCNPSLEVLSKLCGWLNRHGVPSEKLPHGLFGAKPDKLWEAAIELPGVGFYYGEYQQTDSPQRSRQWVSRHDADAANQIIQYLSDQPKKGRGQKYHIHYVPFQTGSRLADLNDNDFKKDRQTAEKMFDELVRESPRKNARIFIGSQRVNSLLELFVADLFHVEPFQRTNKPLVPFYQLYREDDRKVRSCFGGIDVPPGCTEDSQPGIWYWKSERGGRRGRWVCCPWEKGKSDAGVIITVWHPGTGALDLAFFGYTAKATSELASRLVENPAEFWEPPIWTNDKRKVEVFVCGYEEAEPPTHAGRPRKTAEEFNIIRLSEVGNLGGFVA